LFFILLFTTRFFIEFIKEDQSDFEAGMALNMGQILSLPFILAGIAIVIWSLKQDKLSRAYHQEDEVDGKKIPSRQK
jgi:prolipoprotein diacylglyceryltransferase